jgi:cation-transporting ATPase 13A3/4/5
VAVTGKAFNFITEMENPFVLNSVLAKAKVFARMGPDDKANLVKNLQVVMDEQIGMCGDGANDCGALKTADVGISLSEAEASIAAPFTSAVQTIECVVTLLREGRASMATSF